jgi:hypothetical protein
MRHSNYREWGPCLVLPAVLIGKGPFPGVRRQDFLAKVGNVCMGKKTLIENLVLPGRVSQQAGKVIK